MIREVSRVIDQTAPHQLVVAKVLGALNCTDLLRVIKTEGAHPFAATTDGMADMRGTADLVVSFDGGFKYGLAIEVKTTTQVAEGAGPFQMFKAVKLIERNNKQFYRLIGSAPSWWYIVVHTGKLTAKTVSEMDRALLDCPAAVLEGRHADAVPDEVLGVKPLGELLDLVGARLKLLGAPAPLPSPQDQLDLLDNVPVVTLNTPLKVPVWTAPLKVISPASVVAHVSAMEQAPVVTPATETKRGGRHHIEVDPGKRLQNKSMALMVHYLIEEWDKIGETNMKARAFAYPNVLARYEQIKSDHMSVCSMVSSPYFLTILQRAGFHDALLFSIALHLSASFKSWIAVELMPEATFRVPNGEKGVCNLLSRVGYDFVRLTRGDRLKKT